MKDVPSNHPLVDISIRFDVQHKEAWDSVLEKAEKADKDFAYCSFREIGRLSGKEHYHLHVTSRINVNTLRNTFTRTPHYKEYSTKNDNSWYCRLARDVNNHLLYVSKDGDLIVDTLTKYQIKDYIGKWLPKEEFQGDKYTILKQYVDDNYPTFYNWYKKKKSWEMNNLSMDLDDLVIKSLILKWHVENKKSINKFAIDGWYNLLLGTRLMGDGKDPFEGAFQFYKKMYF